MARSIVPGNEPLSVEVIGDKLVISIGIHCLGNAIEWAPDLVKYGDGDYVYPKVTDPERFAREIAIALERESEDGTTAVHRVIDAAAVEAIESGAEGVEIP